jgi:hypothetical protein
MMAEKLDAEDASAGRNYLISVAHFPSKQLFFTDKQVRFSRKTALGTTDYTAVYPGVPAAVVHARAQAIRAGMPPAEALALQLPAAPARLSPGGRVSRGGKRLVEELCGVALVDGRNHRRALDRRGCRGDHADPARADHPRTPRSAWGLQ